MMKIGLMQLPQAPPEGKIERGACGMCRQRAYTGEETETSLRKTECIESGIKVSSHSLGIHSFYNRGKNGIRRRRHVKDQCRI